MMMCAQQKQMLKKKFRFILHQLSFSRFLRERAVLYVIKRKERQTWKHTKFCTEQIRVYGNSRETRFVHLCISSVLFFVRWQVRERRGNDSRSKCNLPVFEYSPPESSEVVILYLHGSGERGKDLWRLRLDSLPKLGTNLPKKFPIQSSLRFVR